MYKKNLMFSFISPTKIVYGSGQALTAGNELSMLGKSRALVVTDEGLRDSEIVASVKTSLKDKFAGLFSDVVPDSSHEIVTKGIALAKELQIDSVVSVGGGSSMDTSKAILARIAKGVDNSRQAVGYLSVRKPTMPHI